MISLKTQNFKNRKIFVMCPNDSDKEHCPRMIASRTSVSLQDDYNSRVRFGKKLLGKLLG